MKKIIYLLLVLAGCSSTTGVQKMGPDTYTISIGVHGAGSVSSNDAKAKKESLDEANKYCASIGKDILVQTTNMRSSYSGSTSELIFQCIDATDPKQNIRPTYRKSPDMVIENRKE